jgi:hypothetical protein
MIEGTPREFRKIDRTEDPLESLHVPVQCKKRIATQPQFAWSYEQAVARRRGISRTGAEISAIALRSFAPPRPCARRYRCCSVH